MLARITADGQFPTSLRKMRRFVVGEPLSDEDQGDQFAFHAGWEYGLSEERRIDRFLRERQLLVTCHPIKGERLWGAGQSHRRSIYGTSHVISRSTSF